MLTTNSLTIIKNFSFTSSSKQFTQSQLNTTKLKDFYKKKKTYSQTHQYFCTFRNWARSLYSWGTNRRSQQASYHLHSNRCPEPPNLSPIEPTPAQKKKNPWMAQLDSSPRISRTEGLDQGLSPSRRLRTHAILARLLAAAGVCVERNERKRDEFLIGKRETEGNFGDETEENSAPWDHPLSSSRQFCLTDSFHYYFCFFSLWLLIHISVNISKFVSQFPV